MNPLAFSKYARHRAADLEHEAATQALVRQYQHSNPTYQLERTYYLAKGLFWFSTALPVGVWVLFAQSRGFTLGQVGLFYGLYSLTVALLEVPSGTLADVWGRKRTVLLACAFLTAAQLTLLWAFSPALLLGWALLYGAGRALVSGALEAWFVDRVQAVSPQTDLQPLFARAATIELSALTLGTLLGGALPQLFAELPADAVLSPLSVTLLASVAVKGVLVGVILYGVRESKAVKTDRPGFRAVFTDALTLSLRSPALRLLLAGGMSGGFAGAGLETFWQPRFAALLGPETFLLSAILAGSFGASVLGNMVSVSLVRLVRGRYARLAAGSLGVGGLGLVALALQTRALPAVLLFWFIYLARGVAGSPLEALLHQNVPSQARAALLSVASLATYVGFFSGSVVLGQVAERGSVGAAWGVAGAVLTASVAVYGRLERQPSFKTRPTDQAHPVESGSSDGVQAIDGRA